MPANAAPTIWVSELEKQSRFQVVVSTVLFAALAGTLAGCKSDPKPKEAAPAAAAPVAAAPVPAQPLSVEESARVKATARVKAIDYTTRVVTRTVPTIDAGLT